jgi:biopolymer transport protein ExbB
MFEHFDWSGAIRTSPIMVVLLACSVLTFGFAIERFVYFWRRRGRPDRLLSATLERLRAGRAREAEWLCQTSPLPFGAVACEVIRNAHAPAEEQEERLLIALSDVRLQLERNLGWLGTMGNTAPLIGLLGTVWGIMRAFHDMANTGSAGPSVVAAGVAEALLTTGMGLVVAVPAVMLYNHFVRRISVMLTVTENHARSLRMTLAGEGAPALDADAPSGPAARGPQLKRVPAVLPAARAA